MLSLAAPSTALAEEPAADLDSNQAPVPAALQGVDIEEHLGATLPSSLSFLDSDGAKVTLDRYLHHDRPVLVTLVYFDCPMLCSLVLTGTVNAIKGAGLSLGSDYDAITVSFNPRETPKLAAERQRHHLQSLDYSGSKERWPFLTGQADQIAALTEAVGFRFRYDEQTKQFAHAAAIFVVTPEGKISRYLYGVEFPPNDLKLALLEAGGGKVGTSFQRFLLSCFQYDPARRSYALFVRRFIQGGGLLVFFALAGMLSVLWRREWKAGTVR